MMKLGNTLKLGVLYALALAIVCTGLFAGYQTFQLVTAENTIGVQQSTITNQKLEIDGLASEVVFLNGEISQLAEHAELVAMLNLEHEQQTKIITDTGNDWLVNSNKLQVSEHEPTRSWASTALPDDARQLLYGSSRSQNGDSKTAGLYPASVKHSERRLPIAAI